ncbi:VOC family protein [Dawidia soli]|uniref:VOC family protein n=1 Tax=Dawidia soli TaxID=2782352 RepID=A0AAP2GE57_9BACT|nr:VOC family protein [Dawidia soli]MBT1687997.1 VOC family protein [Dawidia soli]
MKTPFKPNGYNSVSPYFISSDARKFAALLQQLFQATELRKFDRPDGTIMHMELRIDDSVIMVSQASEEYGAITHMMHVYVADVDAVYKKALEMGCQSLGEPVQKGDPDRRGGFTDFDGNQWYVSTQVGE